MSRKDTLSSSFFSFSCHCTHSPEQSCGIDQHLSTIYKEFIFFNIDSTHKLTTRTITSRYDCAWRRRHLETPDFLIALLIDRSIDRLISPYRSRATFKAADAWARIWNNYDKRFSLIPSPPLSLSSPAFNRYRMCRTMYRRYSDRCCSPSTSCRYSLFAVCAASRTETPRPALYTNNRSHIINPLANYRHSQFRFFFLFVLRMSFILFCSKDRITSGWVKPQENENEWRTLIYFSLSLSLSLSLPPSISRPKHFTLWITLSYSGECAYNEFI